MWLVALVVRKAAEFNQWSQVHSVILAICTGGITAGGKPFPETW